MASLNLEDMQQILNISKSGEVFLRKSVAISSFG